MRACGDVAVRDMDHTGVTTRLDRERQRVNAFIELAAEMTTVRTVTPFVRVDLVRVGRIDRTIGTVPIDISIRTLEVYLVLKNKQRICTLDHLRRRAYALNRERVGHNGHKGQKY